MIIEGETQNTIEVKFEENLQESVNRKDYAKMYIDMHLRVCAYARVSTDSKEQKTSYDSQITNYENLIKSNPNWQFIEVYADEGITGTQLKNRDNFNRMIQDALDGKIDMIIAKSISRFARNTVDTLNIVRLLRTKEVDVYFEKENIHTLSLSNELFLTLYSAFAQGESESISENMKAGLQFKMKRGEPVGSPNCYGYNWNKEKKQLEINEEQAKIVKRIFLEYSKGIGTKLIAKGLNNEGIPSPTGHNWVTATIRRIIKNEKYMGDLRCGKSFVVDVITHKKKINKGQVKQYYTENHHDPIVSKELWNNANTLYDFRSERSKTSHDKYSRRYAFSSKIYCGCCGERFIRKSYIKNKKSPVKERVIIWGCRSRYNDIECESRINYRDEELKDIFVSTYNQLFKNKKQYEEMFIKKIKNILNEKSCDVEKNSLEKEKNEIMQKQLKLIDLSISAKDSISTEILNLKMKELTDELDNVNKKLNEIKNNESSEQKKKEQLDKIMEILENNQYLEKFDDDVFESIVERIIIGEKKEDGTFDYKSIKFILKTGEVVPVDKGYTELNLFIDKPKECNSTFNVNIKKIAEDKILGVTAYGIDKRVSIRWGKMGCLKL